MRPLHLDGTRDHANNLRVDRYTIMLLSGLNQFLDNDFLSGCSNLE